MASLPARLLLVALLLLSPVFSLPASVSGLLRRYQDCHHDWHHLIDCAPDPSAKPTQKGIEPELLFRFARYTAFANLAYAGLNTEPRTLSDPPEQMGCIPNSRSSTCASAEHLARIGALGNDSLVWGLEGPRDEGDDHAYIALPADRAEVVLGVRGSASPSNWIVDLEIWRNDVDWCAGCAVHHGFWESWMAMRGQVVHTVEALRQQQPERTRLVVTGHSLGAAIATLAATELRRMHPDWNIEMFNVGSPRLANFELANYLTLEAAAHAHQPNYRITARDDPIPRLPPATGTGYLHLAPEYYLSDDGADPCPCNVLVADGLYSNDGNSKDGGAHLAGWRYEDFDGDGKKEEEIGFRHKRYFADWTWPEVEKAWVVTSEGPLKGKVIPASEIEGGAGNGKNVEKKKKEQAWVATTDGPLKGKVFLCGLDGRDCHE